MSKSHTVVVVDAGIAVGIKCKGQEIVEVVKGSQAEKKGIQTGQLVLRISGKETRTSREISLALAAGRKGSIPYPIEVTSDAKEASSVKTKTKTGHHVTTTASSTHSTASTPKVESVSILSSQPRAEDDSKKNENGELTKMEGSDEAAKRAKQGGGSKKQEEEALKRMEEEARQLAEEEAAKKEEERKAKNGKVVLKYNMYAEEFDIVDGSITAETIDNEYALSFVMPNCRIFLSMLEPKVLNAKSGPEKYACFMNEEPQGTFRGMVASEEYFVYAQQDSEQERKDQEEARKRFANAKLEDENGERQEGCSCVEGNPCVNEYVCKNWHSRFAIAKKHGWTG